MVLDIDFPSYSYLKQLKRFEDDNETPKEYYFKLFNIYKHVYCRFSYNEDGNKGLYLDIMCNGYSDSFANSGQYFDFTKDGYQKLKYEAEKIYKEIFYNLVNAIESKE